jgi:1-acyl-sn-glycerol-3-phosphate acyltransferase
VLYAHHHPLAKQVFVPYLRHLFRKHTHGVFVLNAIPDIPDHIPIILAPNHSLWWDGFIVYMLNHVHYQRKFHVMMLEEQLHRYWFFQHVGAYSIRQESPRSIVETMRYTQTLLQQTPAPLITIFPQGEQLPTRIRPLHCKRGIEMLTQSSHQEIAVIPLAVRIEHIDQPLPHVIINHGTIRIASRSAPYMTQDLEADITNALDTIDTAIIEKKTIHRMRW